MLRIAQDRGDVVPAPGRTGGRCADLGGAIVDLDGTVGGSAALELERIVARDAVAGYASIVRERRDRRCGRRRGRRRRGRRRGWVGSRVGLVVPFDVARKGRVRVAGGVVVPVPFST